MADGRAVASFEVLDPRTGTRVAAEAIYGGAPQGGSHTDLAATLYLPAPGTAAPVLVWMPPAGPGAASRGGALVRRLARQLTVHGFALAVPRLRSRAGEADLAPPTRARLDALARLPLYPDAGALAGTPVAAAAAAEDGVLFLRWLAARGPALGLAGRPVLGGSAGGAASAFGLAYLAPFLGIERPVPGGVLSFSGGIAWPALCHPGLCPVFALHNPFDEVVPIGPVRALSQADPGVELVEAWGQAHGALQAHPEEHRAVTFGRIRDRVAAWSGAACPEPGTLPATARREP